MTTFWLAIKGEASSNSGSASGTERSEDFVASNSRYLADGKLSPKVLRLVNWNVDVLSRLLVQIMARRRATKNVLVAKVMMNEAAVDKKLRGGKSVINEVEEIITLPKYDAAAKANESQSIQLADTVIEQLREFVMAIAQSYKDNPFHNFEHASHVTMSVTKLLSRIVAPKMPATTTASSRETADKILHDHTYGITSDPLTQFTCIFSALIHDAGM